AVLLFRFVVTLFFSFFFFFSSRRRHTRSTRDWSSDVCSSDLETDQFSFRQLRWLRLKAVLFFYSTPQRAWNLLTESLNPHFATRSEERRVGKECRWRGWRWQ